MEILAESSILNAPYYMWFNPHTRELVGENEGGIHIAKLARYPETFGIPKASIPQSGEEDPEWRRENDYIKSPYHAAAHANGWVRWLYVDGTNEVNMSGRLEDLTKLVASYDFLTLMKRAIQFYSQKMGPKFTGIWVRADIIDPVRDEQSPTGIRVGSMKGFDFPVVRIMDVNELRRKLHSTE